MCIISRSREARRTSKELIEKASGERLAPASGNLTREGAESTQRLALRGLISRGRGIVAAASSLSLLAGDISAARRFSFIIHSDGRW